MPRSFRFDPPEHRVTLVVGGAGLGKTTLLVQAVAENRLASRGSGRGSGRARRGRLLASGNPAAARDIAHRLLQRCLAALTDLGMTPTEPTLQLHRRLDHP